MAKRKAHPGKAAKVKAERQFSPDEVVTEGELLDSLDHKTNSKQRIEVYRFNNYVWAVVVEDDRLVTAWPSRKLKRKYGV